MVAPIFRLTPVSFPTRSAGAGGSTGRERDCRNTLLAAVPAGIQVHTHHRPEPPNQEEAIMSQKTVHTVGIIMNGVTGRMGTNQHLLRSICAIRQQGGVKINDREVIMPDPILVGRSAAKLEALAKRAGIEKWSTELEPLLADPAYPVYFDSATTPLRVVGVKQAIAAGKHIYC
jgi:hypothetical protein